MSKNTMKLPITVQNKIIEFLISLPNMENQDGQQAFIYHSGLDQQLQNQISFDKPLVQFVPLLVSKLIKYGKLDNGQYAIEAILETAKNYIGQDKKAYCEHLLQEVHTYFDNHFSKHSELYSQKKKSTSQVQLILEGEIDSFNETTLNNLVNILAAILKIDEQFVRVLRVEPGSIKITFELPVESIQKLIALFKSNSKEIIPLLEQFYVYKIKSEKLEYVSDRIEQEDSFEISENQYKIDQPRQGEFLNHLIGSLAAPFRLLTLKNDFNSLVSEADWKLLQCAEDLYQKVHDYQSAIVILESILKRFEQESSSIEVVKIRNSTRRMLEMIYSEKDQAGNKSKEHHIVNKNLYELAKQILTNILTKSYHSNEMFDMVEYTLSQAQILKSPLNQINLLYLLSDFFILVGASKPSFQLADKAKEIRQIHGIAITA